MDISTLFGFVLIVVLPIFVVYAFFLNVFRQMNEKKAYKKMMLNTCDATVIRYISALKSTYGFTSTLYFTQYTVKHRNDQQRQSQGYAIIKDSANVSVAVKEQFKNICIANGITVR